MASPRRAARLHLLDLPGVILDQVLHGLRGSDRLRCACACRELRAVYDQCQWKTLILSAQRLVRRGRYHLLPHWTADANTLHALLSQEKMRRLNKLWLRIDTPCFDHIGRAHVLSQRSHFPSVTHLILQASLRHYAKMAAASFAWMMGAFSRVATLTLDGLHLGSLRAFGKMQELRNIALRRCTVSSNARGHLRTLFTPSRTGESTCGVRWPPKLECATLDAHGLYSVVAEMARSRCPMHVPPLQYLDVASSITPFLQTFEYFHVLTHSVNTLALPGSHMIVRNYMNILQAVASANACRLKIVAC